MLTSALARGQDDRSSVSRVCCYLSPHPDPQPPAEPEATRLPAVCVLYLPVLKKMLCPDAKMRCMTEEILKDPWMAQVPDKRA